MSMMLFLRLVADLTVYYAFAAMIGSWMQIPVSYLAVFLLAMAYIIGYQQKDKGIVKYVGLLLILGILVEDITWKTWILVSPMVIYTFTLIKDGNYDLSWGTFVNRFPACSIAYLVFAVFMCLFGQMSELLQYSLPFGLLMMVSMVLLMRSLRHDEEVYTSRRYQLLNCGIVLLVVFVSMLLALDIVRDFVLYLMYLAYTYGIMPILLTIMYGMIYMMKGVFWLLSFTNIGDTKMNEINIEIDGGDNQNDMEGFDLTAHRQDFMIIVLILIACVAIFFLFRYLAKRNEKGEKETVYTTTRTLVSNQDMMDTVGDPNEMKVRKQYRKFMRLYESFGQIIPRCHTTAEIDHGAKRYLHSESQMTKLRELYLQARYHHSTTAQDAQLAKDLMHDIKKYAKQ